MGRILRIDDDDDFRTMFSHTPTHLGQEVIRARNGIEGLELSCMPSWIVRSRTSSCLARKGSKW